MSSIALQVTPLGPIIDVYVGVSGPREAALSAAGVVIPQLVPARLLIDTGASHTCLDPLAIDPLGLTASGIIMAHTPSTDGAAVPMEQFDVKLIIPHSKYSRVFDAIAVSKCNLKSQGIHGLLGRDILSNCLLVYNGEIGFYTLAF